MTNWKKKLFYLHTHTKKIKKRT